MRVFIGVGHGGTDSGAVGHLVEKEVNLVEALACKDFLLFNCICDFDICLVVNEKSLANYCGANRLADKCVIIFSA